MSTLRTTAVLKTDISGSTARFRALPEPDLTALLAQHRELVARVAAGHGGHIVKPEGDGFWLAFPSVTAAALAAMAMQEELRVAETGKGDRRLLMRIVVTLGDVLHQEGALVGDAVVLAARIEALTPTDEIYMSAAAWLAVNQAEVRTSLVDAFTLKGFAGPVPVYRVEQTYRTRVLEGQCIVITDFHGFSALIEAGPITDVERILDRLRELAGEVCQAFDGSLRLSSGDSYCLTFPDAKQAIAAVERLAQAWDRPRVSLSIGMHTGTLYAYRDFLYSSDLNVATAVERAASRTSSSGDAVVFATGAVRRDLARTAWDVRFERIDVPPNIPRLEGIELYRVKIG
jgi:class 3 adenylate cyclase